MQTTILLLALTSSTCAMRIVLRSSDNSCLVLEARRVTSNDVDQYTVSPGSAHLNSLSVLRPVIPDIPVARSCISSSRSAVLLISRRWSFFREESEERKRPVCACTRWSSSKDSDVSPDNACSTGTNSCASDADRRYLRRNSYCCVPCWDLQERH